MKNPVVANVQFIWDADAGIWNSEDAFKEAMGKAIEISEGEARLVNEVVFESHAEYIFYITKRQKVTRDEEDIPSIEK